MTTAKITEQTTPIAESLKDMGERLQATRLAQELTLEQVAQATQIPVKHLLSIESGQLDALPELIYVRGFVRRYAHGLKQDIEQFDLKLPSSGVVLPKPKSTMNLENWFSRLKYPLYGLVVISVGSALVYFNNRDISPAPAQSSTQAPVASQTAP